MPAPKKTTSKTTKAAPAKKTASAKGAASAAKKASAAPKKTVAAKKAPAKKAAAPAAKKAPAKKAAAKTTASKKAAEVVAQIDVGFGNRLTIRGEGAGLSWTAGQTMDYTDGAWTWKPTKTGAFEFKVLLNDEVWAQGDNICADGKSKMAFVPQF